MFKCKKLNAFIKLVKYSDLKTSDFWNFFGIKEIESKKINDKYSKKLIKPGAFQEYIDIEFNLNNLEEIERALLKLNRVWIGNYKNINPFANDIIKSFIYELTPEKYKSGIKKISQILFKIHGVDDEIIYLQKDENNDLNIESSTQNIINVVVGLKEYFIYRLNNFGFIFQNKIENNESFLLIIFELLK